MRALLSPSSLLPLLITCRGNRVMDEAGEVLPGSETAVMEDASKLREMYRVCVRLQEMDRIMMESQRQGRIAFYAVNSG